MDVESPLLLVIVGTVMALLAAVTVFDAYSQYNHSHYDIPKWLLTMGSGVVSASMWWRFKHKVKDKE